MLDLLHTKISEAISPHVLNVHASTTVAFEMNTALVPQGDIRDTGTSACIWTAVNPGMTLIFSSKKVWSNSLHFSSFPWAWYKALLRNLTKGVAQNPLEMGCLPWLSVGSGSGASIQRLKVQWKQLRGFYGCIFVSPDRITTDLCTSLPCSTRGRVLQKAQSQEVSWTTGVAVCFSVITVTSVNHVWNISSLYLLFSTHILTGHTHTHKWKNILSFSINRLTEFVPCIG